MLHDELLYKSVQFDNLNYIGDPLIAVKIFNEKEAQEICIVDTDVSRNNSKINFKLLKDIAGECFMPLSYGGGISRKEEIRDLNRIGYEKVILNTVIHENPNFIKEAVQEFGSSTIIGCIDFKIEKNKYIVYKNGGKVSTNKTVEEVAFWLEEQEVGELLLNNIDCDGKFSGLDISIINEISKKVSMPVIASGGISSIESIKEGFKTGINAIAAGSIFVYKGRLNAVLINYPDKILLDKIICQ